MLVLRRVLRATVAAALLLVVLFLAGMFVPQPFARERGGAQPRDARILILSNPIHTDIAVPLDAEMRDAFAFLETFGLPVRDPRAAWLIVGWGGRTFYIETPTWADLKLVPLLRALTVDSAVLRLTVAGRIDETQPNVSGFAVTRDGLERLASFVLASFRIDRGSVALVPSPGYAPGDRFFEAEGRFNALLGCNTWTALGLRVAGLRTGWWNPVPQSLDLSLRLFN